MFFILWLKYESKKFTVRIWSCSGGVEPTGENCSPPEKIKKYICEMMLIILLETSWKLRRVRLFHWIPNKTPLGANYSTGALLKTTHDANCSTGALLQTTQYSNYSTGALLQTTQYSNYSTGALIKTTVC